MRKSHDGGEVFTAVSWLGSGVILGTQLPDWGSHNSSPSGIGISYNPDTRKVAKLSPPHCHLVVSQILGTGISYSSHIEHLTDLELSVPHTLQKGKQALNQLSSLTENLFL